MLMMQESYKIIAVLVVFLSACAIPSVTIITEIGNVSVVVEIADTPEEHARGLMFRDNLSENTGMLFIFNESAPRTFWMKNTRIHLDMLFINNSTIVHIVERAQPCMMDPCPTYSSNDGADSVLEVTAGFVTRHSITRGDHVITGGAD